ncbi:F-type H+-transporting ATPase subunit delta [Desulfitispora alkaliphila]|uniref:F0F1 ATP synthase subunit delta n=1 Tax=Desulfitispora alkaliphila TaxID=622674 RepID=UPI003D1C5C08
MINKAVARRYAHALFQLAQEKKILDQVQDELTQVVATIEENDKLKSILEHRLIPEGEKRELIKKSFGQFLLPETLNFIMLTIDKKRETYLKEILGQYKLYADEARNLYRAEVTAASQLTPAHVSDLESKLSKLTGKEVKVTVNVNPELIGGLIVKLGDKVIDGSVTKRLEMLQRNLKSINFTVSGVN